MRDLRAEEAEIKEKKKKKGKFRPSAKKRADGTKVPHKAWMTREQWEKIKKKKGMGIIIEEEDKEKSE